MATKTIDHLGFRMDVTPYEHEGNTFNRLSVSVGYQKGRGFYVTLHPVLADGGELYDFSRNPLSDTTWINVEQATKNNSKRLTAIYENVKQGQEAVRLCFDARKWERMEFIIVNLAAHGYADWLKEAVGKFFETTSETHKTEETMANETMKVADLIGKSVCNGNAKYVIKSVEGDKVKVDFAMGDNAAKEMNMKAEQIEKLLQGGWQVQGSEECRVKSEKFTTAQEAPKTEEPTAKTVKMEPEPKPKAEKPKVTLKRKQTEPKTEEPKQEQPKGGLKFVTYMNGSKEQGRIMGFSADDEAYRRGSDFHGSAYPVNGVLCLSFSKKFTPFAKEVCQALNEGKTVDDVLAMLADYDAKRAAAKTERDAKREAKKQPSSGKTYTEAEMLDLMERVMRGDADALAEVNAIKAKAA